VSKTRQNNEAILVVHNAAAATADRKKCQLANDILLFHNYENKSHKNLKMEKDICMYPGETTPTFRYK